MVKRKTISVTRNGKKGRVKKIVSEYVKPKRTRRTKAQMEEARNPVETVQTTNVKTGVVSRVVVQKKPIDKRLAAQFIHKSWSSFGSARVGVMVMDEGDKQYLREAPNAYVFVLRNLLGYFVRIASERFSNDYRFEDESQLNVISKILKQLKKEGFESAVVITYDDGLTGIINGNEAQDVYSENPKKEDKKGLRGKAAKRNGIEDFASWTEDHEKVNQAASRQRVSAELHSPKESAIALRKGKEINWKNRHLDQMSQLKEGFVTFTSDRVDGNSMRHYVNPK